MNKKQLLIIPVIILLLSNIVFALNAYADFTINNLNATDTYIDGGNVNLNQGNAPELVMGKGGSNFGPRTPFINWSFFVKAIPDGAISVALIYEIRLESETNCDMDVDLRVYPVNYSILESSTFNDVTPHTNVLNMSEWNGTMDLVESMSPANPSQLDRVNITINNAFAQRLLDENTPFNQGIIFYMKTYTNEFNCQFDSSDAASADKRQRLYWEYTLAPTDSCTAPGSGDWDVDCSDNCVLDSAQDVVADMHLNGAGTIVLSAPLTFTGSNQIFSVASGCALDIRSGGEIGGT